VILNRYERMIARRYLYPGKGEGFIFLVASISLVAVMLGVAALIAVMSVMNGFRAELFDKIVGLNGHAVIQGYGGRLPDWRAIQREVAATPGVTEAVPLIEQPLMASFSGRVEGVLVRGLTWSTSPATRPCPARSSPAASMICRRPNRRWRSAPGWPRRWARPSARRSA